MRKEQNHEWWSSSVNNRAFPTNWRKPQTCGGQTAKAWTCVCLLAAQKLSSVALQLAGTGRDMRLKFSVLPKFSEKRMCGSVMTITWWSVILGQMPHPDQSGSISYLGPDEENMLFDLFILQWKTYPISSVLITDICLDSRIWPRIEFCSTSVFMTKWPAFYLKMSCFSYFLKQGIYSIIK